MIWLHEKGGKRRACRATARSPTAPSGRVMKLLKYLLFQQAMFQNRSRSAG